MFEMENSADRYLHKKFKKQLSVEPKPLSHNVHPHEMETPPPAPHQAEEPPPPQKEATPSANHQETQPLQPAPVPDKSAGGGKYVCPYCNLACSKPSVLQKHIRAHTNERPYPCDSCGFSFKTRSNLYKHRRSRTHANRVMGNKAQEINNDSDTSDRAMKVEHNVQKNHFDMLPETSSSPPGENLIMPVDMAISEDQSTHNPKPKPYKPRFHTSKTFFDVNLSKENLQNSENNRKVVPNKQTNSDLLSLHINDLINKNNTIVNTTDPYLMKKRPVDTFIESVNNQELPVRYIESSQFDHTLSDHKNSDEPLNLTNKNRKRCMSEISEPIAQKSLIKELLLKNLYADTNMQCPHCKMIFQTVTELELHKLRCKGFTKSGAKYSRSSSVNVASILTQNKNAFDNIPQLQNTVFQLKSPGPFLGKTRLVENDKTKSFSFEDGIQATFQTSILSRTNDLLKTAPKISLSPLTLQNDPKMQTESKMQNELKFQNDSNFKNDPKVQNEFKLQNDSKMQNEVKLQNNLKMQNDLKLQVEPKLQNEMKFQNDLKFQSDMKFQNDLRLQSDLKFHSDKMKKPPVKMFGGEVKVAGDMRSYVIDLKDSDKYMNDGDCGDYPTKVSENRVIVKSLQSGGTVSQGKPNLNKHSLSASSDIRNVYQPSSAPPIVNVSSMEKSKFIFDGPNLETSMSYKASTPDVSMKPPTNTLCTSSYVSVNSPSYKYTSIMDFSQKAVKLLAPNLKQLNLSIPGVPAPNARLSLLRSPTVDKLERSYDDSLSKVDGIMSESLIMGRSPEYKGCHSDNRNLAMESRGVAAESRCIVTDSRGISVDSRLVASNSSRIVAADRSKRISSETNSTEPENSIYRQIPLLRKVSLDSPVATPETFSNPMNLVVNGKVVRHVPGIPGPVIPEEPMDMAYSCNIIAVNRSGPLDWQKPNIKITPALSPLLLNTHTTQSYPSPNGYPTNNFPSPNSASHLKAPDNYLSYTPTDRKRLEPSDRMYVSPNSVNNENLESPSLKSPSSKYFQSTGSGNVQSPSQRNIQSPSPRNLQSPSPRNLQSPSPRNLPSPSPRNIQPPSPKMLHSPIPRTDQKSPNKSSGDLKQKPSSSSSSSASSGEPKKFARPNSLALKPSMSAIKQHHGLTPTMFNQILISPDTPRVAKKYMQHFLHGNYFSYLGLKSSTKSVYCTLNKTQPFYVPHFKKLSMYSEWRQQDNKADKLYVSAYDSRQKQQAYSVAGKSSADLVVHSSYKFTVSEVPSKQEQTKTNLLLGGYESNEDYTYVRGRGRGRYVCDQCGIRCKKPSMLKKHIRTHSNVRPYTCSHCNFSFKTKGNLTKHMKSKSHTRNYAASSSSNSSAVQSSTPSSESDTDDSGMDSSDESTRQHEAAYGLLSLSQKSSNLSSCAQPDLAHSSSIAAVHLNSPSSTCTKETSANFMNNEQIVYVSKTNYAKNKILDQQLTSINFSATRQLSEIPDNTQAVSEEMQNLNQFLGKTNSNRMLMYPYTSALPTSEASEENMDMEPLSPKLTVIDTDRFDRKSEMNNIKQFHVIKRYCSLTEERDFSWQKSQDDISSNKILPKEFSHKEITSKEISPRGISPREILSRGISPREILPREILPREISPRGVSPREISPKEISPEIFPKDILSKESLPKEEPTSKDISSKFDLQYAYQGDNSSPKKVSHLARHKPPVIIVTHSQILKMVDENRITANTPEQISEPIRKRKYLFEEEGNIKASRTENDEVMDLSVSSLNITETKFPYNISPHKIDKNYKAANSGQARNNIIVDNTHRSLDFMDEESNRTAIDNRMLIIDKRLMEHSRIIGSPRAAESDRMVDGNRMQDNNRTVERLFEHNRIGENRMFETNTVGENRILESNRMVNRIVDNSKILESNRLLEDNRIGEDNRILEPNRLLEDNRMPEDMRLLENIRLLENNRMLENKRLPLGNNRLLQVDESRIPEGRISDGEMADETKVYAARRLFTQSEVTYSKDLPYNDYSRGNLHKALTEEGGVRKTEASSPVSGNYMMQEPSAFPVTDSMKTVKPAEYDNSAMETLAEVATKQVKLEKNSLAKNVASEFLKLVTKNEFNSSDSLREHSTKEMNELIVKSEENKSCTICAKNFNKPSQLRLHMNIHYLERPFRCDSCSVSFRTKGHLQKHERSASHHNKLSSSPVLSSSEPRPFKCSDCNIAFRIHGHLAKHLRSKMHIMKLECLAKIPFGLYAELERSNSLLTEINTTDGDQCLESLKMLAKKVFMNDPNKLNQLDATVESIDADS